MSSLVFTDKWGSYHDKPTDGINPSSNNPAIYTAYAKHIIGEIDIEKQKERFRQCLHSGYKINRHPDMLTPPQSHDEIIGLTSLGLIDYRFLRGVRFQFCNLPEFRPKRWYQINYLKAIKQLYMLRNKHRNTVWKEPGYEEALHLAFSLPPQDHYYVKKMSGIKPGIFSTVMFYLNAMAVIRGGDSTGELSVKNKLWLQLKDLGMEDSWLYKKLDYVNNIKKYFGPNHIFSQKI